MVDGCLTGRTLFDRLEPLEALNRETLGQYCLFWNSFFETGNRKQLNTQQTENSKQWANDALF